MTSCTSYGCCTSTGTTAVSDDGSTAGGRDSRTAQARSGGTGSVATMSRTSSRACSSSSARWSVTPDTRECRSPPPSSSGVTTSPIAAFTRGGPPRKIVPWSRTITRLVAHRRHVRAAGGARAEHRGELRDAHRRQLRLVVEDPPEVLAVGEHLVLLRQERAARVDEVDARQPVLLRDLLGAEVLLHRHRVVRAALDRGVVADDHDRPALHEADARDDAGARRVAAVQARRPRAARARGTGCPRRAAGRPGRAAAACRGRHGVRGSSRARRARRRRACRAARCTSSACSAALRRPVSLEGSMPVVRVVIRSARLRRRRAPLCRARHFG